MQRSRITIQCQTCGHTFEVIKCRASTAKYCKRKCYDIAQTEKIPWNKGKTWTEVYGEDKSEELRELISRYSSGQNNPMFGRHHTSSAKQKMSEAKDGIIPWNIGKKYPGMFSHINRLGENNAYIKYVLKTEGITYQEYQARLDKKEQYYRAVLNITNLQKIEVLEHFEKRAKAPNEKAYHLDHIYPVNRGFLNGIPPEIIGDISNLRFIPWKENLAKSDKLLNEINQELYASRLPH
jgi:hypothetical protein